MRRAVGRAVALPEWCKAWGFLKGRSPKSKAGRDLEKDMPSTPVGDWEQRSERSLKPFGRVPSPDFSEAWPLLGRFIYTGLWPVSDGVLAVGAGPPKPGSAAALEGTLPTRWEIS